MGLRTQIFRQGNTGFLSKLGKLFPILKRGIRVDIPAQSKEAAQDAVWGRTKVSRIQ